MLDQYPVRMDGQNTLVLDLTYSCNAACNYCRWGDVTTPGRNHLDTKDLLIPFSTLDSLGVERLVLSGGEPRLHPDLGKILLYYKETVKSIVLITNGYGFSRDTVSELLKGGVDGMTFSIDSVIAEEEFAARKTSGPLFTKILENVAEISKEPRDFEFGINSVVTSVNANWNSVEKLLQFSMDHSLDFVKFQPIFDDGYVGLNSPHLMLSASDAWNLRNISCRIQDFPFKKTNPSSFWTDLSEFVEGLKFKGVECGLGSHKTNVVDGNLTMCYWISEGTYGSSSSVIDVSSIRKKQEAFRKAMESCTVDFHCFCNQRVNHSWK